MKLLRYGPAGQEKPGLLDADGGIRDLAGVIADLTCDALSPASLAKIAAIDPASLPKVAGSPRHNESVAAARLRVTGYQPISLHSPRVTGAPSAAAKS